MARPMLGLGVTVDRRAQKSPTGGYYNFNIKVTRVFIFWVPVLKWEKLL